MALTHSEKFLEQTAAIAKAIDPAKIESLVGALVDLRSAGGRLFVLGVGGSAANCAHAVNDFRKLCDIETYAPTDNVSELTARTNDEGWSGVFAGWLRGSRLTNKDAILVLSVGGGSPERQVSMNLVEAMDLARERGAKIFGIVGRDGGYAAHIGDLVVIVPTVDATLVTPHSEAFQGVVWHAIVSNPRLQIQATKW